MSTKTCTFPTCQKPAHSGMIHSGSRIDLCQKGGVPTDRYCREHLIAAQHALSVETREAVKRENTMEFATLGHSSAFIPSRLVFRDGPTPRSADFDSDESMNLDRFM